MNKDLFSKDRTKAVSFFYKLPDNIRNSYEIFYKEMMSSEDYNFIIHYRDICDEHMKGITPLKYEWIMKHTVDDIYYPFCKYYEILQPTIETIINGSDLYRKYPEYLI